MSLQAMSSPAIATGKLKVSGPKCSLPRVIFEALDVRYPSSSARLGSSQTDSYGNFSIPYQYPDRRWWHSAASKGVALKIVVLRPEREGLSAKEGEIFCSQVRRNAALQEEFEITLEASVAEETDPTDGDEEAIEINALAGQFNRFAKLEEANSRLVERNLESKKAQSNMHNTLIANAKTELSRLSEEDAKSNRYVKDDDSINGTFRSAVRTDLAKLAEKGPASEAEAEAGEEGAAEQGKQVGKVRKHGKFTINPAQYKSIFNDDKKPKTLTQREVEATLGISLTKPASVTRLHLEPDPCRPKVHGEYCLDGEEPATGDATCAAEAAPDTTTTEAGTPREGETGGGVAVAHNPDAAIAGPMGRQSTPENPVEFGLDAAELEPTLTSVGVSVAIQKIMFRPSPADAPSFHDFHDLQIVFEPVWQEALDETYLDDVGAAYDQIVERGGVPIADAVGGFVDAHAGGSLFLPGLIEIFADTSATVDNAVPPEVVASVSINLSEWQVLPREVRDQFKTICCGISEIRRDCWPGSRRWASRRTSLAWPTTGRRRSRRGAFGNSPMRLCKPWVCRQ